jgi:hypothetical protein
MKVQWVRSTYYRYRRFVYLIPFDSWSARKLSAAPNYGLKPIFRCRARMFPHWQAYSIRGDESFWSKRRATRCNGVGPRTAGRNQSSIATLVYIISLSITPSQLSVWRLHRILTVHRPSAIACGLKRLH